MKTCHVPELDIATTSTLPSPKILVRIGVEKIVRIVRTTAIPSEMNKKSSIRLNLYHF